MTFADVLMQFLPIHYVPYDTPCDDRLIAIFSVSCSFDVLNLDYEISVNVQVSRLLQSVVTVALLI